MGTGGHNVPLIKSDTGIRKLTPRETFNVQGFPKDFILPENLSNGALYKQAGNSVVVPVIERIAENIAKALDSTPNIVKPININDTYALYHVIMNGRLEGESDFVQQFNSNSELKDFCDTNKISVLNEDEYLKIIQKNGIADFYIVLNPSK